MALLETLLDAHTRAMRVTLAADLHPAFVRLLATLLPASSCELLELMAPGTAAHREVLLRDNLTTWSVHAPDALVAALLALPRAGPRAELLAALLQKTGAPFAELRRCAHQALAAEPAPYARARALLALARAGETDRVAEAAALLPRLEPWALARLNGDFATLWNPAQREQVRAQTEKLSNRAWAVEVFIALARAAPPEEAPGDAVRALSAMREADGSLRSVWHVPSLVPALPFAEMRHFIDPHLRAGRTRADPVSTLSALAPLAAPDQLEVMAALLKEGADRAWNRAECYAVLSRFHAARREELLDCARASLRQAVGPIGPGAPPYPASEEWVSLAYAVHALLRVSAAVPGEERRWLQQAALERVAAEAPHYEERETISPYVWSWLGEPLEPSLRQPCIDTLLRLADRYSCWGALGEVAACLPPQEQRLALAGLARIADPPPREVRERLAQALAHAAEEDAGNGSPADSEDVDADADAEVKADAEPADDGQWNAADAAAFEALRREVERRTQRVGGSDGGYMLRRGCADLTPRAVNRAVELARATADPDLRGELWTKLVSASVLSRSPELPAALAETLAALAESQAFWLSLEDLPERLLAVCPPRDAEWSERLAPLLSRPAEAVTELCERLSQLAGVLHRLGGPPLIAALHGLCERGLPLPAFAQPFAPG